MKFEFGRCLLNERLMESGKSAEWLAKDLLIKPERVYDFIEKTDCNMKCDTYWN
ncbi:hypothetical protein [Paenibacillus sp. MDMC362]|uniref:hypothetical protein n=1 Tax=Paenibacillus sp. MDMC362 TaxID=2977365 RepID=UPI0021A3B77D|nr:hypothetical protein [Paenibacillus sp. MDMC362]